MTSTEPSSNATERQGSVPLKSARVKTTLLAGLIGIGILVTPVWLAFVGWLLYRAALWMAG